MMSKVTDLVFIAGWGQPPDVFKEVSEKLRQSHRIHLTSVTDLGKSGRKLLSGEEAGGSEYVLALEQMLEGMGERVCIVAWSMGAMVTLELAEKKISKLDSLVLIAGTSKFYQIEGYLHGVNESVLREMMVGLKTNPIEALKNFSNAIFVPELIGENILALNLKNLLKAGVKELLYGLNYLLKFDIHDGLSEIENRCLIVHGTGDVIIPYSASEYLAENLVNAELCRVEGAGHALPMTRGELLISKIEEFAG